MDSNPIKENLDSQIIKPPLDQKPENTAGGSFSQKKSEVSNTTANPLPENPVLKVHEPLKPSDIDQGEIKSDFKEADYQKIVEDGDPTKVEGLL